MPDKAPDKDKKSWIDDATNTWGRLRAFLGLKDNPLVKPAEPPATPTTSKWGADYMARVAADSAARAKARAKPNPAVELLAKPPKRKRQNNLP